MKRYKRKKLQEKRPFVAGRLIVGIDPAKAKHVAQILGTDGLPVGSSFSFATTFTGFHERLWRQLRKRLPGTLAELPRHDVVDHLVFAIEASCNLWPTLVAYLEAQHCRVVMVSPLATSHARPAKSGDFSRTDTKDAFLIADLARQGTFHFRTSYTAEQQGMHRCGVDLHARTMYLCILDSRGQTVLHRKFRTDPMVFLSAVAPYRDDLVVATERAGEGLCGTPALRTPRALIGRLHRAHRV